MSESETEHGVGGSTREMLPGNDDNEVTSQWKNKEVAKLVEWLKEPANLLKTKGKSGLRKVQWMKEISELFPNRSFNQCYNKYNSVKKSYQKAVKLNNQSGWGLTNEDLHDEEKADLNKLAK
ncbi:hypothetical protein RUND412_008261 [Rhizina undulata]